MHRSTCRTRVYNRLCIKVQYDRSSVNMSSKWCCVLAVVCLSVILLSLDADAQPTVDNDSSQCDSASLQQVANMVRVIASNQQAMKNESDRMRAEMEDVKRLVMSCECATVKPTSTSPPEHSTVPPSKQRLVSALVCEYVVRLWLHYTDLTRVQLNEL